MESAKATNSNYRAVPYRVALYIYCSCTIEKKHKGEYSIAVPREVALYITRGELYGRVQLLAVPREVFSSIRKIKGKQLGSFQQLSVPSNSSSACLRVHFYDIKSQFCKDS